MTEYYNKYNHLVKGGYINVKGIHLGDGRRITIFKKANHVIEITWTHNEILDIKEAYIK